MQAIGIVTLIILGLALCWVAPLLVIHSLNHVFGFSIAYTLHNWFCVLVLCGVLKPYSSSSSSN